MKKNLLIIIIMAMMAMTLPSIDVKAAFSGDWEYELVSGGAIIKNYNGSGGNVTIPSTIGGSTVIGIGDYAFYNTSISSVTIPSSVTSIGAYAFSSTKSLTTITIPGSVKTINNYLFKDSSVTSVTMQNGVTTMGSNVFENCTNLNSVTIPASVTNIGTYTFRNCTSLTTISIPGSITVIGTYTFYGCTKLSTISIPTSVTSIGTYAFYGCTKLSTISIPTSVTSVGTYAFYNCSGLTSISIPGNVTSIGSYAFNYCSGLTSVVIGSKVQTIGSYAFDNCTNLTTINLPASVTSIGKNISNGCTKMSSITVDSANSNYSSDTQGILYNKNKTKLLEYPYGRTGSFTIPTTVTTIGSNAFYYLSGLTAINIPSSVTSIESNAFYACKALTTISIPGNVTGIGNSAFYYCTGLTSISMNEGLKTIGDYAFDGCTNLTAINIPSSVTSVGRNISSSCTRLASITVNSANPNYSSDTQGILYNKDKSKLLEYPYGKTNSFTIPNSVTSIGNYAFYNCTNLQAIIIPGNVTSIGESAFSGCTGLTSITIPGSVTNIGTSVFSNCINLKSINILEGVTSIGSSAFYYCIGLTSITIPESVKSIGSSAFNYCRSLTTIEIPGNVTSIGSQAFAYCSGLTDVVIGNGVQTIGDYAFGNCTKLTSIKIPKSITSIGTRLSASCTKLTAITVDADNTKYSSDDYGMLYNKDKTELLECPYGKTSSFIIADSVTTIKLYAFYSNPDLISINIPVNVKTIETNAFYSCPGLASAIFNNPNTTIQSNAFFSCSKLTTIYGYLDSTAETFAGTTKTFIMMGDPITLIIRKDSVPLENVSVTNELLGETLKTDKRGKVYFQVNDYDPETVYNHVINIGDNLYKYSLKGSDAVIVDFKTLKVKVYRDDKLVQNASVSIDTQSTLPIKTDVNGVAQFLLPDGPGTHVITVDSNDEIGRISMTANEMDADGTFSINIDNPDIKCKTITGKALHNNEGVSGVVITASKQGENPLYARTKVDGSYRFILPKDSEGSYTLNVTDVGGYDKGVLNNTQLLAEPGDKEKNFLFDDGLKIEGTVTNTSGKPLPEKEMLETGGLAPTVKLYLEKDNKIWTAETTAGGKYQFNALYPGIYKLSYGISNYIYTRNESIDLSQDTVKDIILTNYSVSAPRNIKYDISVKSPVEPGEWGTVSVKCQNLDEKKYEKLVLEVEIPDGVVIEPSKLGPGQTYDDKDNKVYTTVNLDMAGSFGEADIATFRFMYRLKDGYDKDKVVFVAFAREEQAVSDLLKEYEIPSFSWSRTDENQTKGRNTNSWKWSDLGDLSLDITDPVKVWDGQHERYFNTYGAGADTSKDYATWNYRKDKGSYEYRRFQSGFTKPNKEYEFSHILSENYAAYAGSGAVFPINDEIFMYVYPKGTEINDQNAGQYLAFWGSTQFGMYPNGKFMGVEGNPAIHYNSIIPALKHSDYWFLDGTKNRISEIMKNNSGSQEFIIDVFTSDISEGGGMDKFNLVFTNTEIQQIQIKDNNKIMPYMDFIGTAHADVFKPSLTGDECITMDTARSSEYKLSGQSMKDSDVKIYRLDTGTEVAAFHTDGFYSDITTFLPPVAGTYPFIAECTKDGVVKTTNIHVVEVLDDSGDLELSNLQLKSATLHGNKQDSRDPFISVNVWVNTVVDVSTAFSGLKEGDTIYYKLSGIGRSFKSDDTLHVSLPPATSGTKDVSVIVVRNENIVFNKIIGRIYASIDPSGYVYDKHTQKRIKDATVTCYVLNNGKWEVWKAQNHGQVNPLKTDSNGRYAWDVPEGVYKVTVEKEGFKAYDTINDEKYAFTPGSVSSIVIPPPRLDINMGIENISKPVVVNSWPKNNEIISPDDTFFCEFNKAMKASTLSVDNFTLEMSEKKIPIRISVNKTQNVVSIIPEAALDFGNYTLTLSDAIEDYNTEQKLDASNLNFTVSDGVPTEMESFKVASYSSEISIHDGMVIEFNQAVGSIKSEDVKLIAEGNQQIDVSLLFSKDKKSLKVYPTTSLKPASAYTLVLSKDIESADGLLLQESSITVRTLDKVELPTVDTAGGYVQAGKKIVLRSGTAGADIRYTTDNSEPTESSTKYTDSITITSNVTIKAVAIKDGMTASDVAAFEYIVLSDAETVTVNTPIADLPEGMVAKGSAVTLSCRTDGATIRYTLDGSNPTSSSTVYAMPIIITSDVTIKAAAFKNGMIDSNLATFVYTIQVDKVSVPVANLPSGEITKGTAVTLSCGTDGAMIRYTLDGSNPTSSSTVYSLPIIITETTIIKAIAYKTGMDESNIVTFEYIVKQDEKDPVANTYIVTLDPNGGILSQKTITVKNREMIGTLPTPIKRGYRFKGWYTLKRKGEKITAVTKVIKSITIYAQWEKIPVTGDVFKTGNLNYKVVKSASAKARGSVQVTAPVMKSLTTISIPANVKLGTFTFKVESISKNAFKNNKKLKTLVVGNNVKQVQDSAFSGCSVLTKVTLGKNVIKIGKNVFNNDKKLKNIRILSEKLNFVGKNAFKNIYKKAVIKVPFSKLKKYRKVLKGKGQNKTVLIKK